MQTWEYMTKGGLDFKIVTEYKQQFRKRYLSFFFENINNFSYINYL
jgi:hypothetical protein